MSSRALRRLQQQQLGLPADGDGGGGGGEEKEEEEGEEVKVVKKKNKKKNNSKAGNIFDLVSESAFLWIDHF